MRKSVNPNADTIKRKRTEDSEETPHLIQRRGDSCSDTVDTWACIHGLDCRYVQNCVPGISCKDTSTKECKLDECNGKSKEMHCSIANKVAQEAKFDELTLEVEIADEPGAEAYGQVVADIGGGKPIPLFNGISRGENVSVSVNIPDVYGEKKDISLKDLSVLKLLHRPAIKFSLYGSLPPPCDYFKMKSIRLRVRHTATGLYFHHAPVVNPTPVGHCGKQMKPVWAGDLPLEKWQAEIGKENDQQLWKCLRKSDFSECKSAFRY
ncbi:hypothetical protein RJ55_02730 [Drechmeria coniospora]|nr:hypothetical protein RJ55_02730 [Drechmeria coniospora]